jgi:hypothetical protein
MVWPWSLVRQNLLFVNIEDLTPSSSPGEVAFIGNGNKVFDMAKLHGSEYYIFLWQVKNNTLVALINNWAILSIEKQKYI